jgi:protein-L-isoaspartate(D-aspartate) O-methyltransferase
VQECGETGTDEPVQDDPAAIDRRRMVAQIQAQARALSSVEQCPDIDAPILEVMRRVPRDRFVSETTARFAHDDCALPIGHGQTISQPFIVALMTELASVGPDDVVLEIGTGSGYQTAILAELAGTVYTVELVPELASEARARLDALGYTNVHFRTGDGNAGWPEHAPYDAVVVTAAAAEIPPALLDQLVSGGRLVIPVGRKAGGQGLRLLTRTDGDFDEHSVLAVAFVPLVRTASPD